MDATVYDETVREVTMQANLARSSPIELRNRFVKRASSTGSPQGYRKVARTTNRSHRLPRYQSHRGEAMAREPCGF